MKKTFVLFISMWLTTIACVWSQSTTVTGKVTDASNVPILGVNIMEKNTSNGVTTDFDGNYEIKVKDANATLVFTYVGMKTTEVQVSGKSQVNVSLEEDASALDEVVVVGYGTVKKSDLTGAVGQISSKDLEIEKPNDVSDMLRGNIAGLSVGFSTSAKGTSGFQVRGNTTLTAGGSPLIVLDGTIYNGDISDINPVDIESVSVLKDASSAAVFGARAANGVITITTKKGSGGKPSISFSSNIGFTSLSDDQPVYGPDGYVNWRKDVMRSTNVSAAPEQFSDPRNLSGVSVTDWLAYDGSTGDPVEVWLRRLNLQPVEIENYLAGKSIDWYDLTFQTGVRQDYNLSLSGSSEIVKYYWSVGSTVNEGVTIGDKFTTIRSRLNLEAEVNDFITVGLNTQFAERDEGSVAVENRITQNSPWGSFYEDDGTTLRLSPQDDTGAGARNPYLPMEFTDRVTKYNTLNANLFAKVKLPFGITYQVNYTNRYTFLDAFNHRSSKHPEWQSFGGDASRRNAKSYEWQLDNIFKYNTTINDVNKLDFTFLINAEKYQSWDNTMSNKGFDPNDNLGYHNMGAGILPEISSNDQYSTGDALMGRFNYSHRDKYFITSSVRRDGYSAFGVNNPRAVFPSFATAWVLSEENMLKNNSWINFLKLRYSWGENGNRDIGRYAALSDLNTGKYQLVDNSNNVYIVSQLYVNTLANPNLRWERTVANNVGVDFGFVNNRISGSIELYKAVTKDLLVSRSLPNIIGFNSILDNLGEVENKGIEFSLSTRNIDTENLKWNTSINYSMNRNKIVHLYGDLQDVLDKDGNVIGQREADDISNGWFIGEATDRYYGLKTNGVYTTDEIAEADRYGVKPGDFKVVDVNDDGLYTNADRQFLGYSTPRFRWTMRNQFEIYKNWNFSFMMYSYWGHEGSYNQAKNQGFGDRTSSYVLPYWTEENQINNAARLFSSNGSASYSVYVDKSFVRLQNISLGYTLPKKLTEKFKISSLRLSGNIKNVAVWTKEWDFWDPENSGATPRTVTVGIDVSF
ncbi:TonB-dependent receptor [Cellulophaga sp. F20128]|uniref:SusC/RagA family TonB-linked outer membrane protein n=1 Tax=Cellulophaga sp. F20128 TaxID=2926413 RepID=UPI001FF28689|nr:TonB-dependent receptor [Cellulophaga sp. F20128]MCK0157587.1 TonB-dependent receptor [Cellulophaga sp. F20128]